MTRFFTTTLPPVLTLVLALGCSSGTSERSGSGGGQTGGNDAGGAGTGGAAAGGGTRAGDAGNGGANTGGPGTGGGPSNGSGGANMGGTTGAGGSAGGGANTGGTGAGSSTGGGGAGTGGNTGGRGSASGGASTGGAAAGGTTGVGGSEFVATPPMGWNNYNHFHDTFTQATFERAADAMVSTGLRAVGYQYINIDDTWDTSNRDANGNLVPDRAKFPNGIKPVADYVHGKGLKLGIYADRGTKTCSSRPGSFGYEARDAALFASWGIDFVKVDTCYPNTGTTTATDRTTAGGSASGTIPDARYEAGAKADYANWAHAVRASGRPMVLSLCLWAFYDWEPTVGNMFRTTWDIADNWASFTLRLDENGGDTTRYADGLYPAPGIAQYAGPGHFNDPDMLEVGNSGMSQAEQQAQFSLWAIMAAPLILGNDLTNMSAQTLALLSNAEIIAVDQDPLGTQGTPISQSTTLEVWSKPLSEPNTYAVALFNRTGNAADITVTWNRLGLAGSVTVRDLWAGKDLGSVAMQYTTHVPSHGVVMLKVAGH